MTSIIQNLIKQQILTHGNYYFENINAEAIGRAASLGDITLKDLKLREGAIDMGNSPFKIARGVFGKINVKIPFARLFSEPCLIEIEDVHIVVETKGPETIRVTPDFEFELLRTQFITFVKTQYKQALGMNSSGGLGFWMIKGAYERIIDNLQISIKMVDIDIVDQSSNLLHMNIHLGKLEAKTTDDSFSKEVFVNRGNLKKTNAIIHKKIALKDFFVSIDELDRGMLTPRGDKRDLRDITQSKVTKKKNKLFKFGFEVYLRTRVNPKPTEPEYQVDININNYDFRLLDWQVQKMMMLMENLKVFSANLLAQRENLKNRPEKTIKEVMIALRDEPDEEIRKKKRKATVVRWWMHAGYLVMKDNLRRKKLKKKKQMGGLIDDEMLNKIFQFKLPEKMHDVYIDALTDHVDLMVENQFDIAKMEEFDSDLKPIDLRSILFTLHDKELKFLTKKVIQKLAKRNRARMKNTWLNWATNKLTFGLSGGTQDAFQSEMQKMIKDQVGTQSNKFNQYMTKVNLRVSSGAFTLVGGSDSQLIEFRNRMDGMKITFDKFATTQKAKLVFRKFNFTYARQMLPGEWNEFSQLDYGYHTVEGGKDFHLVDLVKSTVPENQNFLTLDYYSHFSQGVNDVVLDLKIGHLDFFFIKSTIVNLSNFFKIETNEEMRDQTWSQINQISKKSRSRVQAQMGEVKTLTTLKARIKSPRIVLPLVDSDAVIDSNTNLFILYLGDINSKNRISTMAMSNNTFNMELLNFKLEFWEDYGDAIKALNYDSKDILVAQMEKKPQPNFVVLDFSAFIEFTQNTKGNMAVRFISDKLKVGINSHLYHNLMVIPKLFTFDEMTEFRYILEEKKEAILQKAVLTDRVAMKTSIDGKYVYKYFVFSGKYLYFYNDPMDIQQDSDFFLPYCNMEYFNSGGAHILKLTKVGKLPLLLAFRDIDSLKDMARTLKEQIRSIKTTEEGSQMKNSLEDKSTEVKKTFMDLDLIIRRCNFTLYDQQYEKFTSVLLENLDTKVQVEETTRVKFSFCTLMIENCNQHFRSRDLKTVVFMGNTQVPKGGKVHHYVVQDLNHSMSEMTRSRLDETMDFSQVSDVSSVFQMPKMSSRKADNLSQQMSQKSFHEKFDKQTVMTTIKSVQMKEKGGLIFIDQTEKQMSVSMKVVNTQIFWDIEYIDSIKELLNHFDFERYKVKDPNAPEVLDWFPSPEKIPKPAEDNLFQKINCSFTRLSLVCRSKSRNLFDITLIKMKVQVHQYVTKMLNNIFIQEFLLYDLTGHPLTKRVHELQNYHKQKKNILFKFSGNKAKIKNQRQGGMQQSGDTQKIDKLDKNGVVAIIEVTRGEYRGTGETNVGVKAEVFVNNGELNFFMQPTFRLLDFIFFGLMPVVVADDTLKAPKEELIKRLLDPSKNLYNVLLNNIKMNMRPNFLTKKFPVFHFGELFICNKVGPDPSRHKVQDPPYPVYSETLNISARDSKIVTWDGKTVMWSQDQLEVNFKKFMLYGYYERLLTEKGIFDYIDVNNKIKVYIKNLEFNIRKDDYYALMTYVFGNLSWTDEMDDLLFINPIKKEGPFPGMNVQVLIDDFIIRMRDDNIDTFMDLKFDTLFVKVDKDTAKNQVIKLFGENISSDVYSFETNDVGVKKETRHPMIKTMNGINAMSENLKKEHIDLKARKIQKKVLKKDLLSLESWLGKLNFLNNRYGGINDKSTPEFAVQIDMSNKGHKEINVVMKEIGLSLIPPVIFHVKNVTQSTWEMAMNYLIRPTLTQYYGNQVTNLNITHCFLFLLPSKGMGFNTVIHVPHIHFLLSKVWRDYKDIERDLKNSFDKEEFEDPEFKTLNLEGTSKIQVYNMAVMLEKLTMFLVDREDVKEFCNDVIQKGDYEHLSENNDFRMIMKPIEQIGYHLQTYNLNNKFKEIYYSIGVAKIEQLVLMLTTYDIHYLLQWSADSGNEYWKNMVIEANYEKYIKEIMEKHAPTYWLKHMEQSYKQKLEIFFGGIKLVLLDDVYDTNLEIIKFRMMPLTTTQLMGKKRTGFTDINVQLEAEYYNYNCHEWEPILENFSIMIQKGQLKETGASTSILFNNPNTCINFSGELLVILQGIMKQREYRLKKYESEKDWSDKQRSEKRKKADEIREIVKQTSNKNYSKLTNSLSPEVQMSSSVNWMSELKHQNIISDDHHNDTYYEASNFGDKSMYGKGVSIIEDDYLNLKKKNLLRNFNFKKIDKQDQFSAFNKSHYVSDEMDQSNYFKNAVPIHNASQKMFNILNQSSQLSKSQSYGVQSGILSNSGVSNLSGGKNPLRGNFGESFFAEHLPNKEALGKMEYASKFQLEEEVNLKECPFYVYNRTGYKLLFYLIYNQTADSFFIGKGKTVGIPYPYNYHRQLASQNGLVADLPNFAYCILIVNADYSLTEIYKNHEIIHDKDIDIRVRSPHSFSKKASIIHLKNELNIMRELVTLKSPIILKSEVNPEIKAKILFKNGEVVEELCLNEHQTVPIPFDLVNLPLIFNLNEFLIKKKNKNIGIKYGAKKTDVAAFMLGHPDCEVKVTEKHGTKLNLSSMKPGDLINYSFRSEDEENYSINIYVEKNPDPESTDTSKTICLVPPLVIKNRVLTDITYYQINENFGREMDIKHTIQLDEDDYEIYDPLKEKLSFRIGFGRMKSEKASISLKDKSKANAGDVWININNKKAININYVAYYERGSLIIEIFMKAMLVDELFMNLKYSQNIGTNEEVIYPINKFFGNTIENSTQAKMGDPAGAMNQDMGESIVSLDDIKRKQEEFLEAKNFAKNKKNSNIYFLQDTEPLHIADQKYVYEALTIPTNSIENSTHRVFYYNTELKYPEYYDIVCTSYGHTFKSPQSVSTKIIQLKPKYILVNESQKVFSVIQANSEKPARTIIIGPTERSPLFTNDKSNPFPSIKFRARGHEWSDSINLSQPMLIFISLNQKKKEMKDKDTGYMVEKYTNFNIQMTMNSSSYLLIMREDPKLSPFQIKNKVRDCDIFLSQDPKKLENQRCELKIPYGEKKYYCWPVPFSQEKKLYARIYNKVHKDMSNIFEIKRDHKQNKLRVHLDIKDQDIYVMSKISGVSSLLTISDFLHEDFIRNKTESTLMLKIPKLGISVMKGKGTSRRELLYIHLRGINYVSETKENEIIQTIAMKYLNIDYNSDQNVCYPVMVTPSLNKNYLESTDINHFEFVINQARNDSKIVTYNFIEGNIQNTTVQIEENLIAHGLELKGLLDKDSKHLEESMNMKYKTDIILNEDIGKKYDDQLKNIVKDNWRLRKIDTNSQESFINKIDISKFKILLSYQTSVDHIQNQYTKAINSTAFDIAGAILTNIEGAPISMRRVHSETQALPFSLATDAINNTYKDSAKQSLLPVLGSINLLGNPQQFFRDVSDGVQDMFDKPKERFQQNQNPLAVGQGLVEGTGSLAKHTTRAAFGSLNKASKAFADAFSTAHLDNEYNKRRLHLRFTRVNGTMNTVNKGLKQIGMGFGEGIKGLIMKPVEQTQKSGAKGLLKGAYMGISGLFVKPIAGMLDATSTFTGKVRSATTDYKNFSNNDRIRKPRPFYYPNFSYKPYQQEEAIVNKTLKQKLGDSRGGIGLIIKIYQEQRNSMKLLSLNPHCICCIDYKTGKSEWMIDNNNYSDFRVESGENEIHDFNAPAKRQINEFKNIGIFKVFNGNEKSDIRFSTFDKVGVDGYGTRLTYSKGDANKSVLHLRNRAREIERKSHMDFRTHSSMYGSQINQFDSDYDPFVGPDMRKIIGFIKDHFLRPVITSKKYI